MLSAREDFGAWRWSCRVILGDLLFGARAADEVETFGETNRFVVLPRQIAVQRACSRFRRYSVALSLIELILDQGHFHAARSNSLSKRPRIRERIDFELSY